MHQTSQSWQQQLAAGFSQIDELCEFLSLPQLNMECASNHFAVKVPIEFAQRMEKGNPNDPLLKQVLPLQQELFDVPGFNHDPVGDIPASKQTGIIHKYHGRVLLITTGGCAINCRYCFRRNFPYPDLQLNRSQYQQAFDYIQSRADISEVILSGGDPLLLHDDKLMHLIKQLDEIQHIQRIRIHSRIPIVLPSRINEQLCRQFSSIKAKLIMVIHCNHSQELNQPVYMACQQLKKAGVSLLNQSVLLKDINDNAQQLTQLSEKLFSFDVLPYYLHLLDKASGTAHFEVDEETAIVIINEVKQLLPGYLVPKLVKEQAGKQSKTVIC